MYLVVYMGLIGRSGAFGAGGSPFKSPTMFAHQFAQVHLQKIDRVIQALDPVCLPANSLVVDIAAQVL